MEQEKFNEHYCQKCGCPRKLVETIIDDEVFIDIETKSLVWNGFTDNFSHTGNETCAQCGEKWSGKPFNNEEK